MAYESAGCNISGWLRYSCDHANWFAGAADVLRTDHLNGCSRNSRVEWSLPSCSRFRWRQSAEWGFRGDGAYGAESQLRSFLSQLSHAAFVSDEHRHSERDSS